jgi:RNA polymerase sigma-70 factor (ECF subfamily)
MEINPNLSDKAQQDIKFVEAAMRGEQQAFAELMDRYRDTIFYMLLRMVKNKSDADDLTIEAFGKAFKNIHQYTPNFAFSTWLFKIASNNCIDFLRKKKSNTISIDSQSDDPSKDSQMSIPANILDPEENLIKQQEATLMRNIVEKLKPRYRELVRLRYFNEYSYEEISTEMNIPIGTVKAQLFRARELLNNILKTSHDAV